jgi:Flp pilus assembly protein TadB
MKERERLAALRAESDPAAIGKAEGKPSIIELTTPVAPDFLRGRLLTQYPRLLVHAGISIPEKTYLTCGYALAAVLGLAAATLGWFMAIGSALAAGYYFILLFPEERVAARKRRVLRQLPPFIDSIVASLSAGANLEIAMLQASAGVPPGLLHDELSRMCTAMQSGFSLREAALLLRERVPGQEIVALVVALSLFSAVGGTALDPFQRLALKLREQHQVAERATRDLVMVKQSFYLLFVLALAVPPILMAVEPQYFTEAFAAPASRLLIQSGALGVLGCAIVFKKLTAFRL